MSRGQSVLARRTLIPMRSLAIALVACLLWGAAAAAAPDPQEAQALITSTANHMLDTLQTEGKQVWSNPARVRDLAERNLAPHVDFEELSRLVLGKTWRTATPDQRRRFIHEFRQFLIRFYTTALIEYTKGADIPGDVMRFLPLRARPGQTRVTVYSEVKQPGASRPIPVDYHLSFADGEWKVYDVSVDGVSLVASYRNSFGNEVRQRGLDGLIAHLAERNAELNAR
jgi:phospholipid transport system substrate-binding protein